MPFGKKAYGEEHPTVANSLNNLGAAWNDLGEHRRAIEYHERALVIRTKAYGEEHPSVATSLNNLGNAWKALGEPRRAIEFYERGLALYKKAYGEEHPTVALSLNNLGLSCWKSSDMLKAMDYLQQAYALAFRHPGLGPEHPQTKKYKGALDRALEERSKSSTVSHSSASGPTPI